MIAELETETMDYSRLHQEIDRLPEKYRNPIILCYFQGRTQPEAAQILGWPLGTIQIRLHRGRERLRSRLSRSGAGLIAVSRSDLAKALSLTAVVLEREWIDATARAAVRFAAGKATAGLVAPAVAGLTRSVLATMFLDSIRVLALFAIAALLAAAGLSWAAFRPVQVHVDRLPVESRALIATPQHSTEPTLGSSASEAPIAVVIQKPPSAPQAVSGSVRTPADAAATVIDEAALPTQTPIQMIPRFDRSDRSPGPPSGDRSLDTSLRLGRELFERAWVKGDPRTHGGDGLGPVFNGQSCVACHNLGGTGGAGPIDRNIEIATATEDLADYMGFSYSFSMDFGAGRFDYRIGSNPQGSSRRDSRADPRFLSAIHAGFQDARSVVLHRFGTDPAYNACASRLPAATAPWQFASQSEIRLLCSDWAGSTPYPMRRSRQPPDEDSRARPSRKAA